jgi:hypothetical protein
VTGPLTERRLEPFGKLSASTCGTHVEFSQD